jgi:triphosphoribosyl-dephospho-CoA synthase
LQEIVRDSLITEINALKPGNVSRYADGHGMTLNDFLLSADLVTPILCNKGLSMGQRILESVKITRDQVGTNTNLGMLLLFAPIIITVENIPYRSIAAMQKELRLVLSSADKADAGLIFQAIKEANPGGLGQSAKYDVHSQPDCTLFDAMAVASERDAIARQYTSGFHDIFSTGLAVIKEYNARWNSVEWATVACYLTFFGVMLDSHIVRKYGSGIAEQVRKKAAVIAEQFKKNDNPENAVDALLEFDRDLKDLNINPGTSADIAAAGILVYKLVESRY